MSQITLSQAHKYGGLGAGIGHGPAGSSIIDLVIALQTSNNELDGKVNTSGATAGVGATAVEVPGLRKLTLTLVDAVIPMSDDVGIAAYGSLKVADLPEGAILHMGAVADLDITKSSAGVIDTWDGDVGIGTAAATTGATLITTQQDLMPSTPTPQAVAGVTTADGQSTATEASAVFDGTATPVEVHLNFKVDDVDHDVTSTPCNLLVNGTITVHYSLLGDY